MGKTRRPRRRTFRSLESFQKAYLPILYQKRKAAEGVSEEPEQYGTTLAKQLVADLKKSLN
jgi:hypothetical protein